MIDIEDAITKYYENILKKVKMKNKELLENQLKEARRVVWPNTGQEAAIKFVYQLADHVKNVYDIVSSIEMRLEDVQKEIAKCETDSEKAGKKQNSRKAKANKEKSEVKNE